MAYNEKSNHKSKVLVFLSSAQPPTSEATSASPGSVLEDPLIKHLNEMLGAAGFEPATPASRTQFRSTVAAERAKCSGCVKAQSFLSSVVVALT